MPHRRQQVKCTEEQANSKSRAGTLSVGISGLSNSAPISKELRSHYSHDYNKKQLYKLKINDSWTDQRTNSARQIVTSKPGKRSSYGELQLTHAHQESHKLMGAFK